MTHLPPRLLAGAVTSTVGRVLGTAVSVGTVAIITRSLVSTAGPSEGVAAFGVYATVLAVLAVIAILADGGLYVIFTREASREGADERALLETVWPLRMGGIVLALLVAVGVALLLPYSQGVRIGILVGMWGVVFQLGSQLLMGVFQKRLRLATPATAEAVGRLVQFLLAVIIWQRHGGVLAFLGAFVVGTLVTFLWNLVGAQRLLRFRLWGAFDHPRARRILREAWPLALSLILSMIFFKVDSVMLSLLRPPSDVALYALPYKILESLLFFPAMVGGMILPVFARASTRGPQEVGTPLRSAVDLYLLGALPLAALLFLAAPWVVVLLGGTAFSASAPVLQILSVTLGMLFFGNLFGNAVVAIGEQRRLLRVYALLTVVNVGANLLVIPRFSYIGAAWTTFATELLSVLLTAGILLQRGIPILGTKDTARILLSGAVLLVLLLLPLRPLSAGIIGLSGYCLVLLWTGVLLPRDLLRLIRAQRSHA
jgi:O-antigen/teichoic acid export membrane protein